MGHDFGAAGMPEALQPVTFVLSENIENKELGITWPNKCGNVKLLNREGHRVQARRLPVAHRCEARSGSDGTDGNRREDQQASANAWKQEQSRAVRQGRMPTS